MFSCALLQQFETSVYSFNITFIQNMKLWLLSNYNLGAGVCSYLFTKEKFLFVLALQLCNTSQLYSVSAHVKKQGKVMLFTQGFEGNFGLIFFLPFFCYYFMFWLLVVLYLLVCVKCCLFKCFASPGNETSQ